MTVVVATAAQAAARDAAAIAAGIPSRALMRVAGVAAAGEIARRFADRLGRGVAVHAGPGNNGGDAWVIAGALAAMGVGVRVHSPLVPRTPDAVAERDAAHPLLATKERPHGGEEVVVDGLLGTGSRGAPRAAIADAVRAVREARAHGAAVVALDLPTGLDADGTVADPALAVEADLTLAFGTLKRAHLVARGRCGRVALLDIGLGAHATGTDDAPQLVDHRDVRRLLPPLAADAHKGTRGRLLVAGGGAGMAGAAILAARAALACGAGLVRLVVAPESVAAVHAAIPAALVDPWPDDLREVEALAGWGDALVVGPGLGRSPEARRLLDTLLGARQAPAVLDADALNRFEGGADLLGELLRGRRTLLTPHPLEFARLSGHALPDVLAGRFDLPRPLAEALHAAVLLKGVPTVVADDAAVVAVARGTPVLATGGAGDLLAGIAGVLLAQGLAPRDAGSVAAWLHGVAAEIAGAGRVRGVVLDDVLAALPQAFGQLDEPSPAAYPVLVELPPVPER